MRAALVLGLSLGAHLAFAAALFAPHRTSAPDPAPRLAGETFELPAPESEVVPLANASPSPAVVGETTTAEGDGLARPAPPTKGRPGRPSHAGRPSGGRAEPGHDSASESSGPPALYGAVGDRSATDLATAFTRGFSQAASGDAVWRSVGLGSAGEADLVLVLDATGHLESTQILGAPSAALASGIRRTMALIKSRPFVAKGRTTRLHVVGTVSNDEVHDGLHGDVFAIGGSFPGPEGNAWFALAIGRRIDVRIRLR